MKSFVKKDQVNVLRPQTASRASNGKFYKVEYLLRYLAS